MIEHVDIQRAADLCWRLVNIPSPTRKEKEIAEYFGEVLGEFAEVHLDYEFPESPIVVARLKLGRGGRILQFDGHLDHIAVDHDPPVRADEEIIARGACDMKSGLAAMAEAGRVLAEYGEGLDGEFLLTAHGLHEAPLGFNQPVYDMVRKGYLGDAVIVCEGAHKKVPVAGMGMAIYEVEFTRDGEAIHENQSGDTPNPLVPAVRLAGEVLSKRRFGEEDPYLGRESWFLGEIKGGDFYNRVPVSVHLQGTRRWHPEQKPEDIEAEIRSLVGSRLIPDVRSEVAFKLVGRGWRTDPDSDLIHAVQAGWQAVGIEAPVIGTRSITNTEIFSNEGKIPATGASVDNTTAHGDVERVRIADIETLAKVLVVSARAYFRNAG